MTNTGSEILSDWAMGYNAYGEINGLWNAQIYGHQGTEYILKAADFNSEILPGQTINFGYTLSGDEFKTPQDIRNCAQRVDITDGFDVYYNIVGDLGDYEKLVHTISDTNCDFCISKKDVFDIIHKFPNTTLAYHSNDKYYIISKKNGEYTVGYNFIVRHKNIINIVFWGKHKNDGIFSFPSIEEIWKSYGSKNTIKRISISSLEGLYQISEFMINSIDWILYKLNTEYVTTF